jgi:hypothetical protein
MDPRVAMVKKHVWMPADIYNAINRYLLADSMRNNRISLAVALACRRSKSRRIAIMVTESHQEQCGLKTWVTYKFAPYFEMIVQMTILRENMLQYISRETQRYIKIGYNPVSIPAMLPDPAIFRGWRREAQ